MNYFNKLNQLIKNVENLCKQMNVNTLLTYHYLSII
jgi:hypothetical protein